MKSIGPLFLVASVLCACGAAPSPVGNADAGAIPADAQVSAAAPHTPAQPAPAPTAVGPGKRCGWLIEGPMADWYLRDKDGEWTLAEPTGEGAKPYQAAGLDKLTSFPGRSDDPAAGYDSNWIDTAEGLSYTCACLTMDTDSARKRATRITAASAYNHGQCSTDALLPKPPA